MEKPRITKLKKGGWLCAGRNLGGIGWTPAGAYWAWLNHPQQLRATRPSRATDGGNPHTKGD